MSLSRLGHAESAYATSVRQMCCRITVRGSVCVCVCARAQMCARGFGQLQQAVLLRQHPCVRAECHRARACRQDELEGTVLPAFVRHVWHEQTVLAEVEGFGLRELRARAVSNSREFCSVTAVLSPVVCIGVGGGLWRVQREGGAQLFVVCPSRSVVSPPSGTDHNLLYENLSSSASSRWVFLTPFPAGLESPLVCGLSSSEAPAPLWQWPRAGRG